MIVVIGAETLLSPLTGIGRYTYSLLRALFDLKMAGQYYCVRGPRLWKYVPESLSQTEAILPLRYPTLRKFLAQAPYAREMRNWMVGLVFKKLISANCPGAVYHEPNYVLRKYGGPTVATIHDLSVFKFPESHPARRVRFYRKEIPKTVERADALITDSEFSRREVIEEFGVPEEKVTAIHLGVDRAFHSMAEPECREVLERHGLKYGEYLLSVGTLEPRKNFGGLIDAYCGLDGAQRKAYPLVLAGPAGWRCSDLLKKIKTHESNGICWLDYVPERDLPAIYSGARAFAYPSLYEGFGLPALEAACCGVPVLTSANSPMEEFCPESSVFVNPRDTGALVTGLREVLGDKTRFQQASDSAGKISETYSWESCARKTVEVYKRVLRK